MPLFRSGSGGTADNAGASAKSEDEVSKGLRKQDAEEGATGGALPLSCDERSRETSPLLNPPEDTRKRDKYALLIGVQLTDTDRAGSCMLPHYAWNPTVIKDILSSDIEGISDVIVMSPMECMVFTGQRSRGQGFSQAEAMSFAREIHNARTLSIGRQAKMRCVPRTLRDARADLKSAKEFMRGSTYGRVTGRSGEVQDAREARQQVSPWDDSGRHRGMVRRSDRYFADRYLKREVKEGRAHSAWPPDRDGEDAATAWVRHYAKAQDGRVGLGSSADRSGGGIGRGYPLGRGRPEDVPQTVRDAFHSAREDLSDSPPEYLLEDSGDESDDIVAYDTTTSRYTTVADRERREKRDQCRAYRERRREKRQGPNGRRRKLNLPIFRDSTSDNAITYDDWRSEVDNYVREGHSHRLITDSVLSALEGHPRHTAKAAMLDGDGSLKSVMSALDQVYGGATTYTTLLNKLNGIQQGYNERAKDYYECVLQIRVKLQEFHAYMFRRGDLERQTKEAFFNGLRPEYQAMVVHKRDDPRIGMTDLLSAVRECEENEENNRRNR